MSSESNPPDRPSPDVVSSESLQRVLEHLRQAISTLRYGQVLITVQDGVVVQIDRTERTRMR